MRGYAGDSARRLCEFYGWVLSTTVDVCGNIRNYEKKKYYYLLFQYTALSVLLKIYLYSH